jgi:peptidoglycan DL-endopeptidase CwlO
MKTVVLALLLMQVPEQVPEQPTFMEGIKTSIEKHLGRRYVWGSSGLKSFDCSGFIWRVMFENGVLFKRTTARKFYMMLPTVPEEEKWNFGTIVFFDNLKHVGIVDSREAFYHAQVTLGTNRSPMNSFWRRKVFGFRRLPAAP